MLVTFVGSLGECGYLSAGVCVLCFVGGWVRVGGWDQVRGTICGPRSVFVALYVKYNSN